MQVSANMILERRRMVCAGSQGRHLFGDGSRHNFLFQLAIAATIGWRYGVLCTTDKFILGNLPITDVSDHFYCGL
jgi:hypothetical protein